MIEDLLQRRSVLNVRSSQGVGLHGSSEVGILRHTAQCDSFVPVFSRLGVTQQISVVGPCTASPLPSVRLADS